MRVSALPLRRWRIWADYAIGYVSEEQVVWARLDAGPAPTVPAGSCARKMVLRSWSLNRGRFMVPCVGRVVGQVRLEGDVRRPGGRPYVTTKGASTIQMSY
jgi:hypothetical protein